LARENDRADNLDNLPVIRAEPISHELTYLRREFISRLKALDRFVNKTLEERDRRYEDRFKAQETTVGDRFKAAETAVSAALAAQKELTNASFIASEKAIGKAETAQADYNVRSNEFRGQLDDQAKTLMPRAESQVQFKSYDEKIEQMRVEIASLREYRSAGGGAKSQQLESRQQSQWVIGLAVSAGIGLGGLLTGVIMKILIHP
jgi:hypothetical protein